MQRHGYARRWPAAEHDVRAHQVTRANKGLVAIAAGVLAVVAGIYGWFGEVSIALAGLGLLLGVAGLGALLSTQSSANLTAPHPYVYVPLALAVLLHGYENLGRSSGVSYGWFSAKRPATSTTS